ncbi:MAG: type II secretion system F family protein [Protaetiibacter sp.]
MGAIGGIVLAAISGFLVLAVIVPAAAVGVPYLLGKADTREKDTLSALEAWARSLAAASATGRLTLRDVIVVTRTSTPEILRPAVDRMHQRIVTTWSVGDALRAFAEELDSSWADEVSIYLIQAADYSSEGLADALNALADNLASQVKMRAEIYREREKPRRVMIQMVLILVGTLVLIVLLGRTEQLAPFSTALGQLLLVLVLASMAALLLWARAIARPAPEPRFLLEHGAER